MKKTLAAVAVLGAFAGSALAADVTLYGKVDLGLQYQNINKDTFTIDTETPDYVGEITNAKSDTWGLKSGSNSGSRWGIKGSEQISDDLTVGFQLEQGFTADDGKLGQGSRTFGREARLYVQTAFGELGMGRMGGLDSGLGSYNLMGASGVFGTGWGSTIGANTAIFRGMSDRMDNTITYKSPKFAGVNVYAQVSLDPTSAGKEASSDTDRYYALAAKGQWEALEAGLVVSSTDYARTFANASDEDNSMVVSGYGAYDFGVMKTTLGVQYYDNVKGNPVAYEFTKAFAETAPAKDFAKEIANSMTKGYGVMLGATAPVAGGKFLASVGYGDYEVVQDSSVEGDVLNVGVAYQYPLSKRTYVYAGAGYTKGTVDLGSELSLENKTVEVVSGLVHNF